MAGIAHSEGAPGGDAAALVAEARDAVLRFRTTQDPQLLTIAVERVTPVVDAPGFAGLDPATRGFALTLAAAAANLRSRTEAARPNDLDRAIRWTEQAVEAWPRDDPNLPRARANLATALADRHERDGDPADLDRALDEYDAAIPTLRAHGDRVDIALHGQAMLFHERARIRGGDVADLDRAVAGYREALSLPGSDADEQAGYRNSLGLSLRAKGRAGADPDLLRTADTEFRTAIADARPGSDNSTAATLNLAAVLQDRAEEENDAGLLREAVERYRGVLPHLGPDRRARATTNAATALIDLFRYTRDRRILDDAVADLRSGAAALSEGASRSVALANLAAALHEVYSATGRIAVLDQAIAVQEQLLDPPADRPAERTLNLGVSLLARFRRRRDTDDLDRAIALFDEAQRASGSRIERASALNSQANAMSLRHDLTGDPTDVHRCVAVRERAVAAAPPGSIDVALYRANLGVDLLKRFTVTGDVADLDRAVDEQRAALRDAPAGSVHGPRLLAGLADSLASRSDRDPGDTAEARATYRAVVDHGLESEPEQALAAAVRWGEWEAAHGCWAEAATAYQSGLRALTRQISRQDRRADKESWLGDAAGLPAAAALACVRAGDPTGAVTVLDGGRAMLLSDALGPRRLVTHAPD
jgi:hypothetical protein